MKKLWLIFFFMPVLSVRAQSPKRGDIVSRPMPGQVELRAASIRIQVSADINAVSLIYCKQSNRETSWQKAFDCIPGKEFNPIRIDIAGLNINTQFGYPFTLNHIRSTAEGSFHTKDFWRWRKPTPDFSFLPGGHAYFNESIYDCPVKPYEGDSVIFESMAKGTAVFALWLGDNWYTWDVDLHLPLGLWYRAWTDRAQAILCNFLKKTPPYAIWDDRNYGPNNSGSTYGLKDVFPEIFLKYWYNLFYGDEQRGIYSQLFYSDVDLFLKDDYYFRSADEYANSVKGKLNPAEHFFLQKQLHWLEDALVQSLVTFKIIAIGNQSLNPMRTDEGFYNYSFEYNELTDFLNTNKIKGVLFLKGDRQHSEIVKANTVGNYDLFDITVSLFASGVAKVRGFEMDNPARVPGSLLKKGNYAKISFQDKKKNGSCMFS